jgi:hypothetical protein
MFGQLTVGDRVHRVDNETMAARKIQIGQLWKKKDTGDTFLVTRVYNEALSTFVVLRKSGSEGEDLVRVKADRTPDGQGLPGFVPAVEEFDVSDRHWVLRGGAFFLWPNQIERTGSATISSVDMGSFWRKGSPYLAPMSWPWWRASKSMR